MLWKKVRGLQIEVNKFGEIRNSKTKKLKKLSLDRDGYKCVNTRTTSGKSIRIYAHRTVARHFCKGYKKHLQVNHDDLNKSNNYYKNLIWCTQKTNIQHANKNDVYNRRGEANPSAKLKEENVINIRWLHSTGYYSANQLSKLFNVSLSTIKDILVFKKWRE